MSPFRIAVTLLTLTLMTAGCAARPLAFTDTQDALPFELDAQRLARWFPGSEVVELKAVRRISSVTDRDGVTCTRYFLLARSAKSGAFMWELVEVGWCRDYPDNPSRTPVQAFRKDASEPVQVRSTVRSIHAGWWAIVIGRVHDPEIRRLRIETSAGALEDTVQEPHFWAIWQVGAATGPGSSLPAVSVRRIVGYNAAGQVVYEETQ